MKRCLCLILLLVCIFTGVAAAEAFSLISVRNFFEDGQYAKLGNLLPKNTGADTDEISFIRIFYQGWTELAQGDIHGAQTTFANLNRQSVPHNLSANAQIRCQSILQYISGRAFEERGMLEEAMDAYSQVPIDGHDTRAAETTIQDFQARNEVFSEINDIYADAQIRIVALREGIYAQAGEAFACRDYDAVIALMDMIPDYKDIENYAVLSREAIDKYNEAREEYADGYEEEAIELMRDIVGYKDSEELILQWSKEERKLSDLIAVEIGSEYITFEWTDSWADIDGISGYCVRFDQSSRADRAREIRTKKNEYKFENLIPNTAYTVIVGIRDSDAEEVRLEVTTRRAPDYDVLYCGEPAVVAYNRDDADQYSLWQILVGGFTRNTGNSVLIPSDPNISSHEGYMLYLDYVAPKRTQREKVEIMFVLRVGAGEKYVQISETYLPENTSLYRIYTGLDTLLNEMHRQHGSIPKENVYLEVYINGKLVDEVFCSVAEEK